MQWLYVMRGKICGSSKEAFYFISSFAVTGVLHDTNRLIKLCSSCPHRSTYLPRSQHPSRSVRRIPQLLER